MTTESMARDATFSECRTWRYSLTRFWHAGERPLVVIGLNPSTADETQDDPTIRRCIGYAKRWGFGSLVMLNLFALRSTDPKKLRQADDPVGPGNDRTLRAECWNERVLCAWGTHGAYQQRGDVVRRMLFGTCALGHLGHTKNGHPRHPLYLRATEEWRPWVIRHAAI